MKNLQKITPDSTLTAMTTVDSNENRLAVLEGIKFRFILILIVFFAFFAESSAQVSLPYNIDFEPHEGFINKAPLSGDLSTADTSTVVTDDTAQSKTQSVRIKHPLSTSNTPNYED